MAEGKITYHVAAADEEAFLRQFESYWTDEQLDLVTSGFKGVSTGAGAADPDTADPRSDPVAARNVLMNPATTFELSEQPFVLPLIAYLNAASEKIPPDIRLLSKQFALYLVKYSVDAYPRGKERFANVDLRLNYGPGGGIFTQSMTPDTTFEERFAATAKVRAALDPHLEFKPVDFSPQPGVSVGGGIEVASEAGLLLQFEYRPLVAKIVALGKNSSFARWMIDKPERMVGNVGFATVVRVPHRTRELALNVQGSYRLERGLWWWQRETTVEFASLGPIVVPLPSASPAC